jgi:hypothetical protein
MGRGWRRTTGTRSDAVMPHRVVLYVVGSGRMRNLERRGCMVSHTDMIQEGGGTYLIPSNKYTSDVANWRGIG